MATGVITTRNQGKSSPEAYWKGKLLSTTRAVGCAFVENGKIEKFSENKLPTIESINQTEKEFDFDQVVWLGTHTEDFQEDDLQPYTLVRDFEDNDVVVGFIVGTLDVYEEVSDYSNAYRLSVDLAEKFQKVYDDCAQDVEKMWHILTSEGMIKDLKPMVHPDATIVILCCNGKRMNYAGPKTDIAIFPWGATSSRGDYTEGEAPLEKKDDEHPPGGTPAVADPEPPPGLSAFERMKWRRENKGKGTAAPAAAASPPAPKSNDKPNGKAKTSVPSVDAKAVEQQMQKSNKQTDTRPAPILNLEDSLLFPPSEYTTPKARGKWFNRNYGFKPEGYETGKVGLPYSKLKPNSALRIHRPGDPPRVMSEIPPIISPKHIEQIVNSFIKDIPDSSLLTDAEFMGLEDDYASFFEQCNDYPVDKFLRWSLKKKRDLVKDYPQAAYTVIVDLCSMLAKANPKLLNPPKEEKPPEPVVVPAEGTRKSASERRAEKQARRM